MNVSLHPRLARFVQEQVQSGRFQSAEDVVNGALARLQAESELSAEEVDELRIDVSAGIDEADRGQLLPWDPGELWAEVERRAATDKANGKRKEP